MGLENNVTLKEVFSEWADKVEHPIIALETGCSSEWKPEYLPFLSTPNLADIADELHSVDNDSKRIEKCQTAMSSVDFSRPAVSVWYHCGDSISENGIMSALSTGRQPFNFVWLDSAEDSANAVKEFLLVQRYARTPYVLCVDDYGNPSSVKWQVVSDVIKLTAKEWKTYDTPTGLLVGLMGME